MRSLAALIGIAKPIPWALPATAVSTPTTAPVASSSGPPLLPGLIAASVWMRSVSCVGRPVTSSRTVISRPSPLMIPLVTVSVNVPSGLPIAIAVWPTWIFEESPIVAAVRPLALILMSARSVVVDCFTRVAGYSVPSIRATVSDELPSTTWRFVRM